MYPFETGSFAPRNAWYVACFAEEVRQELISRIIVNTPLVIYRKQDGEVTVLGGRCPHRHFPLGKSHLENDVITCGYHGFSFGSDGQCVNIPSQDHTPKACRIPQYPAVEHGMWLWVWVGDPEKADPDLLPSQEELALKSHGLIPHTMFFHEVECRYQLLNDNLFDLSHLAFLHGTSIGTLENASTPEELEKREGFVSSMRHIRDAPSPPLMQKQGRYPTDRIDRSMGMASYLPGLHMGVTDVSYPASHPQVPGEKISHNRVYHAITPSTPGTCYYHFAVAVEDGVDVDQMRHSLAPVIDEDIFASVEIEKIIALYDGDPPAELMVKSDRNAVEGRRMLQAMMDAEQAEKERA
ncbi:aromatic ring-hydroxylating dioxygenase subunit alpha [Altericroceibacterium endophyticum]|uniref:Rieske 2Fe-2S domain-containing protein n=1 Tax=Altericroceibacterium endophyticum TaxID=1808508 RepID=A0A6I4T2Z5_9SPHN|nr:aromatic ring-hydroxylating dioxygenase subunit alpha [Altericroceibacterium endophyticum]MXO65236.1 Rieske 2Fe-2S domain-containing protein [Altericroceibacterium endophyticum]